MLKEKLSIIIICYDPYEDAIRLNPFYFSKHWPQCDLDIIYVTSECDVENFFNNQLNVKTRGDLTYFGRLSEALKHLRTDYAILLLDDYLLNKDVCEKKLEENVDFMISQKCQFCELFTMFTRPKGIKVEKGFIQTTQKNKYRINLQPSIFSKDLLVELASKKPITAWDAEIALASKEFEKYYSYFSLNKSRFIPYLVLRFSIISYSIQSLMLTSSFSSM